MKDDWRLTNQKEYLFNIRLKHSPYVHSAKNDHDHCAFCWDKFSDLPGHLHEGYCTLNEYHWICETCYEDFKEDFQWEVQEDIFFLLENIFENQQTKTLDPALLWEAANRSDWSIRNLLAEKLVFFDPDIAEPILLQLLNDSEKLVRVNACDSLCISHSEKTRDILLNIGVKGDYLMRGYAILSATDITIENKFDPTVMVKFLQKRLEKEKSTWVKINGYSALYRLGEKSYLQNLLAELDNPNYKNRCLAAHSLRDIINEKNKVQIRKQLKLRLEKETSVAVKSSINDVLQVLADSNREILEKRKKDGKYVAVYTDEDHPARFMFGQVIACNETFFVLKLFSPSGESDGFVLEKISCIHCLKQQGKYFTKMKKLIAMHENNAQVHFTIDENDLVKSLLLQAKENHHIVSLELLDGGILDPIGFVAEITNDICKIQQLDEYGEETGISYIPISAISEMYYDTEDEKILTAIWERSL